MAEELALRPVLALTATATPEVARDICRAFGIAAERHVQTSFRRNNLHLRVTPCAAAAERLALLTKRLASAKVRPAVVYVTFQKTAEDVAAHLAAAGPRGARLSRRHGCGGARRRRRRLSCAESAK